MLKVPPFVKDPELLLTASRESSATLFQTWKKNYQTEANFFDKLLIFFNAFSKHKKSDFGPSRKLAQARK